MTAEQVKALEELGFTQYGTEEWNKRYAKIGRIWITARSYGIYVSPFWVKSNREAQRDLATLREKGIGV